MGLIQFDLRHNWSFENNRYVIFSLKLVEKVDKLTSVHWKMVPSLYDESFYEALWYVLFRLEHLRL